MNFYIQRTMVLLFSLFVAETGYSQSPKYAVEYGTIEYKTSKGTSTFYFVDYGNKFREEITRESVITTQIYDGKILYSIENNKVDTLGEIRNPYFRSANPEGYKRYRRFKTLPPEVVAGRDCTGFEYHNAVINQSVSMYGFGNIIMKHYVDGILILEAVKFDPTKPLVSFSLK